MANNGTSNLLDAARWYLSRGYQPVPIPAGQKGPRLKGWQNLRLTDGDLSLHFNGRGNIGLLLGEPSGGLVDVDLDCDEARELAPQYLPQTPAITGRPSAPNSHWWYIAGGVVVPAQHRDPLDKGVIVELRSTGQQTVVGPSMHPSGEPYDALVEDPARVDGAELARCVAALAEAVVRARHGDLPDRSVPASQPSAPAVLPEDEVERRAAAYLDAMPPAISGEGGHNATYAAATAMVHGFGLSPDAAMRLLVEQYNPRCVPPWSERELEHKVADAASKPHSKPQGWLRDQTFGTDGDDVDLSAFGVATPETVPRNGGAPRPIDPGPLPTELLRVPGFINEVMDFCLETAPYPNVVMAFCGALALQAFLAGRKVRDPGDNRTNIYVLGLAHSAAGKDWPRKLNTRIAHSVGLGRCLGERLASGEGVQDALFADPAMLIQTDEIDGMLQAINKSRDARHESMMTTLLTLYSASNSIYPMRRKAGKEHPGVIQQPCLVIFGTAIPNHYYEALSERMLTNGFFARMLIMEAGPRAGGQEPGVCEPPARVLEVARWWAERPPGSGNLANANPTPAVVEQTEDARLALIEMRQEAEDEYAKAEASQDAVGTTVWGRVSEQVRKLALIYAVSENYLAPQIGVEAVHWASRLVMHQVRRMLFMAAGHVAENPFHADCLRLFKKLRDSPGRELPHQVLLKRMKMDAKSFRELIETVVQSGDVVIDAVATQGRTRTVYRFLGEEG